MSGDGWPSMGSDGVNGTNFTAFDLSLRVPSSGQSERCRRLQFESTGIKDSSFTHPNLISSTGEEIERIVKLGSVHRLDLFGFLVAHMSLVNKCSPF
uniref:Uncharacterized protein n=1 Tax=Kalanchoe fedtschenkoi TaxID=63787 RepID=A0A7N0TEI7_KALFE